MPSSALVLMAAGLFLGSPAWGTDLGVGRLLVAGTRLTVSPESQTVPFDTPTVVETHLEGYDPAAGALPTDLRVRADLTGPEIQGILTLETVPGQPLRVPRLRLEGEYLLRDIRLVSDGEVVAYAEPRSAAVLVTQVLVTRVSSRALTLEEIRSLGIVVDGDSFQAFNFTFGFAVAGDTYEYDVPVGFDLVTGLPEVLVDGEGGGFASGSVAQRFRPPQLAPFTLQLDTSSAGGQPSGGCEDLFGDCRVSAPVPLPGVILFPTDVRLLHQFFSVVLVAQNGAPAGDPLVIRDLTARPRLPPGLRLAETDPPTALGVPVPVRVPGPDGELGTADDITFLVAQASGEAEVLVEGLNEGSHLVELDLAGVLEGLPEGPQPVKGQARGAVIVRDPTLAVTITHPDVVRTDEEYSLLLTVSNTGNAPVNLLNLSLPPAGLSGVTVVGSNQQTIASLPPGDAELVEFRLRSQRTGRVAAAAVRTGGGVSPSFELTASVGENGVPLSPTSIILPRSAQSLPDELVRRSLALVGLGFSLATAPPELVEGHLPRVTREAVDARVYQLAQAGRHVGLGEELADAAALLALEWLGLRDADPEWDELRRTTEKGGQVSATVGGLLATEAAASSPAAVFDGLLAAAGHLPPVAGVLADGTGVQLTLSGLASGSSVAGAGDDPDRLRDLPFADLFDLGDAEMALVAVPEPAGYRARLEVPGGGSAALTLAVPAAAGGPRRVTWSAVTLGAGGWAEVDFVPGGGGFTLGVDADGDGTVEDQLPGQVTVVASAPLAVVAAVQSAAVDPTGHVLEVLFSADVDLAALLPRDPARFEVAGRTSNGGLTASDEALLSGSGAPGERVRETRVVRVVLDNPLSPYETYDLTVRDVAGASGGTVVQQTVPLALTVATPGARVEGRVIGADGIPVPFAEVDLVEQDVCVYCADSCRSHKTAAVRTGADGTFAFDYVRQTECGDTFELNARDPARGYHTQARGRVRSAGSIISMDLVMLGRGTVRGRVLYDDGAVPSAPEVVAFNPAAGEGRRGRIDPAGHYEIREVPVGTVTLSADDGAGAFVFQTVEVAAAGALVERDLVIPRLAVGAATGDVRGSVYRDDGVTPVEGSYVALYVDGNLIGVERSGIDGGFDFGTVPAGLGEIEAFDGTTGLTGAHVYFEVEPDQVNPVTLLLRDERGTVEGYVFRRSSTIAVPVAGAVVWAGGTPFHAVTDAAGFYRLEGVFAGTREIYAADVAQGQQTRDQATVTADTTVRRDLYFADPTQSGIAGQVLGTLGQPVSGATVHLAASEQQWFGEVVTDSVGRFILEDLGTGKYSVHAFRGADGGTAQAEIRFPGDTPFVTIRFEKGTIRGTVQVDDGSGQLVGVQSLVTYRTTVVRLGLVGLDVVEHSLETAADGTFEIPDALLGRYELTASNPFYGDRTVRGELTADGQVAEHDIVFGTAGEIRGVVLDHDGVTPVAGARVDLRHPAFAVYDVATDADGRFTFALVPPDDRRFPLDVEADDDLVFRRARTWVELRRSGQELEVEIVLPAQGTVSGRVEDAGGVPVPGAVVTLAEHDYPKRRLTATADVDANFRFDNVFQGGLTLSAQAPSLGGLGGQTVTELTAEGEVLSAVVTLEAAGEVSGRVLSPVTGGPVAGAEVELWTWQLVDRVTTDAEGRFHFRLLPLAVYEARVFDPATGRNGRAQGLEVTAHGQVVEAEVTLEARGEVDGHLYEPATTTAIPAATVALETLSLTHFVTYSSTDGEGYFEFGGIPEGSFRLTAREPEGRRRATAEGAVTYEDERVTVDLFLEAVGTVLGTVLNPAGLPAGPFPNANARIEQDSQVVGATLANPYAFDGIIAGRRFHVYADEVGGPHRGLAGGLVESHGEELTVDVPMVPIGSVVVTVADSFGSPVAGADVRLKCDGFYGRRNLSGTTAADGSVAFGEVGAGSLAAYATDPATGLKGSLSGSLATEGEVVTLAVALEDSGEIVGRVVTSDGITPAADAAVSLKVAGRTLLAFADGAGAFAFGATPLGSFTLTAQERFGPGTRVVEGEVAANGEVLDLGTLVLDDLDPQVAEVVPAPGAVAVPLATTVTVRFSEPLDLSKFGTLPQFTTNWVQLRYVGGTRVPTGYSWSADATTLTMTPDQPLDSFTLYEVRVNDFVVDLAGRRIPDWVRSSFTTADTLPPAVIDVQPPPGAEEVGVAAQVQVTFDEPVLPASVSGGALQLSDLTAGTGVTTTYQLMPGERQVVLNPASGLVEGHRYQLTVQGVADGAGNAMATPFVSDFWTVDTQAPEITPQSPAAGATFTSGAAVTIAAQVTDDRGVASVTFTLGGRSAVLTAPPWSTVLPAPAVAAAEDAAIEAEAVDLFGNAAQASWTIGVVPSSNAAAPAVELDTCLSEGDLVVPGIVQPVRFTLADDEAIESYSLLVDGVTVTTVSSDNGAAVEAGFSWEPLAGTPAGTAFTLAVEARDFAFNTTSASVGVVVAGGTLLTGDQALDPAALAGADVVLAAGTFTAPGPLSPASLSLLPGATLTPASGLSLEVSVAGTLRVQCDAALDVSGLGYPGGIGRAAPGGAPSGVTGSQPDAGGSHGGLGDPSYDTGPAGEMFDSVYDPRLGGGGGSTPDLIGSNREAGAGGGSVVIEASELVLGGAVRAVGATWVTTEDEATGAGGSVLVTADLVRGGGVVDASGGSSEECGKGGSGGGGRIALYAGELEGFDPAPQARAFGGRHRRCGSYPVEAAAPGTVFVQRPGLTWGELTVDSGEVATARATPLPALGQGTVGSLSVDSLDPGAAWIEPQDPGVLFDLGVVGMWVRIAGADYRVIDQTADRRSVLLAGASGQVAVGDAFEGVYKFDSVTVRGGAHLEIQDVAEVAAFDVDGASTVSYPDRTPPVIGAVSPAEGSQVTSGELLAISAEVTDDVGVTEVRFSFDGASFTAVAVPYGWSVTAPQVTAPTAYAIQVEAVDGAGNTSSATRSVTVVPDTSDPVPPAVALAPCPADGDVFLPGAPVSLSFTASDNVAVESYSLVVDGAAVETVSGVGQPVVSGTLVWTPPAAPAPGAVFTVSVEVEDAAANLASASVQLSAPAGPVLTGDQSLDAASLQGESVALGAGVFTVADPLSLDSLALTSGATLTGVGAIEVEATGEIRVQCGATVDATALGYAGGAGANGAPGKAPAWVSASEQDAGGSHGGSGVEWELAGPAGEVFGSVYEPALGGGGGSLRITASGIVGGSGGGAVRLEGATVVLDGTVLALGESRRSDGRGEASGAGGSVLIVTGTLRGSGAIDASGGWYQDYWRGAGSGGGGRVALYADAFDGFDPGSQVQIGGGALLEQNGTVAGYAAPGTMLHRSAGDTLGTLVVDSGAEPDGTPRVGPATELPELGSGTVVDLEVSGSDAWLAASSELRPRWLGAWVVLEDGSGAELGGFRAVELDAAGRLLLEGAAGVAAEAAEFKGEYRFDRLELRRGASLVARDRLVVSGEVVVTEGGGLPPGLEAGELTVTAGSRVVPSEGGELRLQVSGRLTVEAGASLDVSGLGYPGGAGANGAPGQAPPAVSAPQQDAGGSHGGSGVVWELPGPPGESYDSVYSPSLAGGGGSLRITATGIVGGAGGGVIDLDVGELVLEGDILALGESRRLDGRGEASGAGGTVVVRAGVVQGAGRIDASGGWYQYYWRGAGSGGGGRVALEVGTFAGFDPAQQVLAAGGARRAQNGTVVGHAAPGTIYLKTPALLYGDLLVDQGAAGGLTVPNTRLPAIGTGTIGAVEADAEEPADLWIEPQDPGTLFDLGVDGMWLRIAGSDYRVLAQSSDRRRLLLEGATGVVAVGQTYAGIYKFDTVRVRGGAVLEFPDLREVGAFEVDPDSGVIP